MSSSDTEPKPVTREERARSWTLIRKGRKLSRAKDLEAALAAFGDAVNANPQSATAACEAGFAALRLDKLIEAQHFLEQGLQVVQSPKKEAACRYNLGLVAEKQGHIERALVHFRRSLFLRDTKAVRKKIGSLEHGALCPPPVRVIDPTKVSCGLPDDYWDCGVYDDGTVVDGGFELAPDILKPVAIAPGKLVQASNTRFGMRSRIDLILTEGGKHTLIADGVGWFAPVHGETRLEKLEVRPVDLVSGAPTELVVTADEYQEPGGDEEWDACEAKHDPMTKAFDTCYDDLVASRTGTTTYQFVCGELEGRWACARTEESPTNEEEFLAAFRCVPTDSSASVEAPAKRDALIDELRAAAKSRDYAAIEAHMRTDFFWGDTVEDAGPQTAKGAIAALKKRKTFFDDLSKLLSDCAASSPTELICPSELVDAGEYGDAERLHMSYDEGRWSWAGYVF